VAVMRAGIIDQIGDGHAVYDTPATPFVASFVGENNVFRGKISAINGDEATISTNRSGELLSKITPAAVGKLNVGDDAMMFVRPEVLKMQEGDAKTTISAKVLNEEFEGNSYSIYLEGEGGKQIKMAMPNLGNDPHKAKGDMVSFSYNAANAVVMPAGDLASE
jgi:spermidine/putrescine transport system ATP-binding protein